VHRWYWLPAVKTVLKNWNKQISEDGGIAYPIDAADLSSADEAEKVIAKPKLTT
jgi:hypothetical protein